jgi:hypothetical protein
MREEGSFALMRCGKFFFPFRFWLTGSSGGVAFAVNCAELEGQFYIPVRVHWLEARETGHTQFLRLHYDLASR